MLLSVNETNGVLEIDPNAVVSTETATILRETVRACAEKTTYVEYRNRNEIPQTITAETATPATGSTAAM